MQKTLMICLISFATFLSGCETPMPRPDVVQRCVIDLKSMKEICNDYQFLAEGGYTIPDTEVIRPISDRQVTFPVNEWIRLALWRDELIWWYEDMKEKFSK